MRTGGERPEIREVLETVVWWAVLAAASATAAVHHRGPALSARHPVVGAVRALRHLHSGDLGDYLAWLTLGLAAPCAAIVSPT